MKESELASQAGIRGDRLRSVELLWGSRERPGRGPKPALSLEAIAAAGIEIADQRGLVALSMHDVAERLGFTTMSLYRYFPGKTQLIDVMLDTAIGLPPALDGDGGWRRGLERWARAYLAVLLAHPWVLAVVTTRPPGPNQVAWLDAALQVLTDAPLTVRDKLATVLLISGHVRGAAQVALGFAIAQQEGVAAEQLEPAWVHALEQAADDARFPSLSPIMASGAFEGTDSPDYDFDFGLRRVLDGIEAFMARRPTAGRLRSAAARVRRRGSTGRTRSAG